MSASDRQDAARKALEAYDKAGPTCYKSNDTITGESYNALDALAAMADVLRDLTTPPVTIETPEQIASRLASDYPLNFYPHPPLNRSEQLALMRAAVHAGVQAAWESWEPESVPTEAKTPDAVDEHFAKVCESAGLGVMVQVFQIVRDRETVEDGDLLEVLDGDVTGWYFDHIAPAIDSIESDIIRLSETKED